MELGFSAQVVKQPGSQWQLRQYACETHRRSKPQRVFTHIHCWDGSLKTGPLWTDLFLCVDTEHNCLTNMVSAAELHMSNNFCYNSKLQFLLWMISNVSFEWILRCLLHLLCCVLLLMQRNVPVDHLLGFHFNLRCQLPPISTHGPADLLYCRL